MNTNKIENNLQKIKAITFINSVIDIKCVIDLEDECVLSYTHNIKSPIRDSNFGHSKLLAYEGAIELFHKLYGNNVPVENERGNDSEYAMSDLIYNFIETNTFDVKKLTSLINTISSNLNITGALNRLAGEFIPKLMAGRATGHTHAIKRFIVDNPNLRIGVVVSEYQFRDDFKKYKNAYMIRKCIAPIGFVDDRLHGVKLDYIIYDVIGDNGLDINALQRVLYVNTHDNTRLVGLGN